MAKKIVSYEVNCKIQFTKMICAEIWQIFIQKYRTHANFHPCANFISILEFDLGQILLEWNQATEYVGI